jgi:hypothetical protein
LVCDETPRSGRFCRWHNRAFKQILRKYPAWKAAKDVSPEDYLKEIVELPETGQWVGDVARYILADGKAILEEISETEAS